MDDITGLLNNVEGEYKNVLTAANSDTMTVNNTTSWNLVSDIYIEFQTDLTNVLSSENIISFGDSSGSKIRLARWSNSSFRLQASIGGSQTEYSVAWVYSGLHTIRIDSGIVYVDNVMVLDFSARNAETLFSFTSFHFGSLSYSTTLWYSNQEVYKGYTIDSETFNPSASGLTYKGSEGTVVTRNTSHSGAENYINQDMIQEVYGSGIQRKRVLTAANSDYLSFTPYTLVSSEGVSVNYDNHDLTTNIYVFGSSSFGNCYVIASNSTVQVRSTSGTFTTFNHSETTLNTIEVNLNSNNLEVIINGNNLGTQDATGLTFTFDQINERGTLGFHEDATILSFTINSETFNLNEGNGVNFKGSNGTIGTCNTSHSGAENYINQEMIKPI